MQHDEKRQHEEREVEEHRAAVKARLFSEKDRHPSASEQQAGQSDQQQR